MSWCDSSSEEKYEFDEDDDIAMIMLIDMEKNKRPKHGGSVIDREVIRRSQLHRHNKLILDYFSANLVYLERYF